MTEAVAYILLFVALAVPVPGAIALRALAPRLGERRLVAAVVTVCALAIGAAIALGVSDVRSLHLGGLSLLQPGTRFSDDLSLPFEEPPVEPLAPTPAN